MILGAEIGLFVYGIVAMIRRKFSLGKRGQVTGWRAVVLGLICFATLPAIAVAGFAVGLIAALRGHDVENMSALNFVWVDILILVLVIGSTAVLGRIFLKQQERELQPDPGYAVPQTGYANYTPVDSSNPYAAPMPQSNSNRPG